MVVLAAFGGAAFLLVCLVGGARLLWLARRTHGLPEAVLGGALFGMGERSWRRLHASGECPSPLKLGRSIRWSVSELHLWGAAGCPDSATWELKLSIKPLIETTKPYGSGGLVDPPPAGLTQPWHEVAG